MPALASLLAVLIHSNTLQIFIYPQKAYAMLYFACLLLLLLLLYFSLKV